MSEINPVLTGAAMTEPMPYELSGFAMPPMLPQPPPEVVKYSENSKNAKAVDPEGRSPLERLVGPSYLHNSCQRSFTKIYQYHLLLGYWTSYKSFN